MNDNLIIPLLLTLSGAVLLVVGWLVRSKSRFLRNAPLRLTGGLVQGETQFVVGTAHSPVKVTAPSSKKECVFYTERVERLKYGRSRGIRGRTHWDFESMRAYGFFFLKDADGSAVVLPGNYSLDLEKPAFISESSAIPGMSEVGDRRSTEQTIREGEAVTVLGVPRPLCELLLHLRASEETSLPAELWARLDEMEKDPALAGTPCFFGEGLRALTDRTPQDYVSGTAAAGASYLAAGALVLAAGLAAVDLHAEGFHARKLPVLTRQGLNETPHGTLLPIFLTLGSRPGAFCRM